MALKVWRNSATRISIIRLSRGMALQRRAILRPCVVTEASLLRVPGQDRIDPRDKRVELRHVVPQEFRRLVVRDLAVLE